MDESYGDLVKYGLVKSFERNFGKSPSKYILEFNTFLENNRNNTRALENLLQNSLLVLGNETKLDMRSVFDSLIHCQWKALQRHFAL